MRRADTHRFSIGSRILDDYDVSMALFSSSLSTGIEITSTSIRAAQAVRRGEAVVVQSKVEQALAAGIIVRGAVVQQSPFFEALKKTVSALPMKARDVVLCLPPESVACSWVLVPSPRGGEDVKREIEKLLPYEQDDLQMLTHMLGKQESQDILCFVAVHKELMKQYVTLCGQAGLHIIGVTTGSAALVSAAAVNHNSLLVRQSGGSTILTVLRDGWTIDEELFSSQQGVSASDRVVALLKEYAGYGMPITDVSTIGVMNLENIPSTTLLRWLLPGDVAFAGPIAASIANGAIPINFQDSSGGKSNVISLSFGLIVIGVIAVIALLTFAALTFIGS
jgi:hypothetical protein